MIGIQNKKTIVYKSITCNNVIVAGRVEAEAVFAGVADIVTPNDVVAGTEEPDAFPVVVADIVVCNNVIVVFGYKSAELRQKFQNQENITIIENIDYTKGMFTSVQTGVSVVKTDYFFITHGDLPLISPNIYLELSPHKGPEPVFPVYNGRRGHPVLLPKTIIETVMAEDENSSMKKLLTTYPTRLVPVNTNGIYMDIDTDEDYKNLLNNHY